MSLCMSRHMSKIMCTPIKVSIHIYTSHAKPCLCQTLHDNTVTHSIMKKNGSAFVTNQQKRCFLFLKFHKIYQIKHINLIILWILLRQNWSFQTNNKFNCLQQRPRHGLLNKIVYVLPNNTSNKALLKFVMKKIENARCISVINKCPDNFQL